MTDTTENQGIDLDAVKAETVRTARKNDAEIFGNRRQNNKRDLAKLPSATDCLLTSSVAHCWMSLATTSRLILRQT